MLVYRKPNKFFLEATLTLLLATVASGSDKIIVVTSLPDLADISKRIGGDHIEVTDIAKGYQDPHFVDPKPSHVLKMTRADIFVHIGLDLEIAWVPPLLEKSRNRDIYFGGSGYINASEGIPLLEIPDVDPSELRAQGDIHIYGNPHYWLDPINGKIIANHICEKLSILQPESAEYFQSNLETFHSQIDSAMKVWNKRIEPFKNRKIVAYHNSWPYFTGRFGIEVAGFIEPKPGIPPTPRHLVSIIRLMRSQGIKVIIISPYFDDKPARSVAERTDSEVVSFAPSVGAFEEVKNYFDLFDYNLNMLVAAFEKTGGAESSR